jgi:hypothetical protein
MMWDGTQDLGSFLVSHGIPKHAVELVKASHPWSKICDLKKMTESDLESLQKSAPVLSKVKTELRFLIYWVASDTKHEDEWTREKEGHRQAKRDEWEHMAPDAGFCESAAPFFACEVNKR